MVGNRPPLTLQIYGTQSEIQCKRGKQPKKSEIIFFIQTCHLKNNCFQQMIPM